MRVRTWLLWLAVAAGLAWFAWSHLDAPQERLAPGARAGGASPAADAATLFAEASGPRLVGFETSGGRGGADPRGAAATAGAVPSIEFVVVDASGRPVPRFQVCMKGFGSVGSHGRATLALAFPGNAALPGPYDVRVYGACDEAGVGLDLGAAHVQVVSCDGEPVRVVLPAVDALSIQVRDEGGAGVQGLGVRIVTPAKDAELAPVAMPPRPPELGVPTVAGVTGADGSVRLARIAPRLPVDVECEVPSGFLPCFARGVEASRGRVELELRRGCAAEVQVDSALGRVAGAQVELKSEGHGGPESTFYASQLADEEGRARFPLLDPRARYSLFVGPPGWEPSWTQPPKVAVTGEWRPRRLPGEGPFGTLAPLLVEGWAPTDMAVRLARAQTLSGHVFDGEGVPVAEAVVSVHAGDRLVGRVATDATGSFAWVQPPDGPLTLRLALHDNLVDQDPVLVRTVAPRERAGLELRVETHAQRFLDVTFPSAQARDEALAVPLAWCVGLAVFTRVVQTDGSWSSYDEGPGHLVPLDGPFSSRARLRLPALGREARAEIVIWQQDVGFVHAPLPGVGERAVVPLERGEALQLVSSHVRRGETWHVRLTSARYDGLDVDAFVSIEEDGVLALGGLPSGAWAVVASHHPGPGEPSGQHFQGTLEAQARTGERTVPTEVAPPAR